VTKGGGIALDPREQEPRGLLADRAHRQRHRGQRRLQVFARLGAVEAHQRDIAGNGAVRVVQRPQRAHRERVGAGQHRGHAFAGLVGQQLAHRLEPFLTGQRARTRDLPGQGTQAHLAHHAFVAFQALALRRAHPVRGVQVGDAPVPETDQVPRGRAGGGKVIGGDVVGVQARHEPVHEDEGDLLVEQGTVVLDRRVRAGLRVGIRGGDDQAVDALGFEGLDLHLLLPGGVGGVVEHQVVVALGEHRLRAREHLAPERGRVTDHGADRERLPGAQAAGQVVALVAQLLGDDEDALARFLADARVVVDRERDGGNVHAGPPRHIFHRRRHRLPASSPFSRPAAAPRGGRHVGIRCGHRNTSVRGLSSKANRCPIMSTSHFAGRSRRKGARSFWWWKRRPST
jgi:hypothetical protein